MRLFADSAVRLLQSWVVRIQIANAVFVLWLLRDWRIVLTTLVCLVAYYEWVRVCLDSRIKLQRQRLGDLRRWAAKHLGMARLASIEDDDWDKLRGLDVLPWMLNWVGFLLAASYIWEGRYMGVLNLASNFGFFFAATQSPDSAVRLFTGRFNAVLHMTGICTYGTNFSEDAVRRMIIIRILVAVCHLESIHELFFQTVLFPTMYIYHRFGLDCPLMFLPLAQFTVTVLPTEILGFRQWLLRKARNTKHISASTSVALVTMLVPLGTAIVSFGVTPVRRPQNSSVAALGDIIYESFPFVGLAVALLRPFWARRLDSLVQPSFGVTMPSLKPASPEEPSKSSIDLVAAAWVSTMLILALSRACVIVATVGLACVLATLNINRERRRQGLILFESGLFAICPMIPLLTALPTNDLTLGICCARLWLHFENRRFSDMAAESLFVASVQCFFAPVESRKLILAIMTCGMVVSLALSMANENSARFIKSVKDADSFLDHAVKQKFSGIGSGVLHVLEVGRDTLDPATVRTLDRALIECRQGLAACHLSSTAIKYEAGAFSLPRSGFLSQSVVRVLRGWSEELGLPHPWGPIPVDGDEGICLSLNWDLLKSLLIDMTKECASSARGFMVTLESSSSSSIPAGDVGTSRTPSSQAVTLASSSSLPFVRIVLNHCEALSPKTMTGKQMLTRSIWKSVARALGGRISADGLALEFPWQTTSSSSSGQLPGSSRSLAALDSFSSSFSLKGIDDSSSSSTSTSTSLTALMTSMKELSTFLQPQGLMTSSSSSNAVPLVKTDSTLSSTEGHVDAASPNPSPSPKIRVMRALSSTDLSVGISLPPNLAIAVLDDNSLVRKSMGLIVRLHLSADLERSLVTGETYEQAVNFSKELIAKRVDIAIFDENLEYQLPDGTDRTLKGTTLATAAMEEGFQGCMVLHSANAALGDNLAACFHGFIEKTSSRDQLVKKLAVIYRMFQSDERVGLTCPSTT